MPLVATEYEAIAKLFSFALVAIIFILKLPDCPSDELFVLNSTLNK